MHSLRSSWSEYIYLKDQKFLIVVIALTLAVSSYVGFVTPQVIKDLYESYQGSEEVTYKAIYALAIVFGLEYLSSVFYQLAINRYVQKLLDHIRSMSFTRWILSIETAGKNQYGDHKYPMGEVLSRVLTDTEAVIEMVSTGSFKIFIDIIYIVSCLIGFIKLNTISGGALIIAEVITCILLVIGGKKMGKVYMAVQKSVGNMSRIIANLAGGFRFTYFHPHGNYASKRGYSIFEDFLKKQLKANIWDASYFSIAESLFPILLVLLVLIFPYSRIVEVSVLAAIIDLIQRSIAPIKEITGKISSIQRARTGITRIEEFNRDLKTLPKTVFNSQEEKIQIENLTLNVEHFSYPTKEDQEPFIIEGVKIEAQAGMLVGLVGQSGCGKSTLLKMLATDILADKVSIDIKGRSKKIHLSGKDTSQILDYKSQVSIVSQESHVFSASLKFNITMSYEECPDFEGFWNNALEKIPYLKTWIIRPEDEVEVKKLSLGQKQLLSALRSCYLAKPIVLFDEISSGLDSELEEALRILVLLIQKQSLTFIVAHRIETIIHADNIIVMESGKTVAEGKHSFLLEQSKTYQDFISRLNS